MAKALSQEERDEIARLMAEGKSRNEIAALTGRSNGTITRLAAEIGHRFGQTNLTHAHEARSAYSAERRAALAAKLTEEAELLLEQLHEPYTVFNFGGKENTYNEAQFDEPPVDAKFTIIRGAREALRTVLDIDRHDNRNDDNLAAVDEWLRSIVGGVAA
jgi:hypothetical protein